GVYLAAPELSRARQSLDQNLGPYDSLDALISDLQSWLGGEIFVAASSAEDFRGHQYSPSSASIDIDCREPAFIFGAAIGDRAAFASFMDKFGNAVPNAT